MRFNLRGLVAVGSAAVLLAACTPDLGGDSPSPSASSQSSKVLTVPEALKAELAAADVRGFILLGGDKVMRLCAGLLGSYPPQCGMPALTVVGLPSKRIPNPESDQGIVWSGETTLHGSLSGGVLTVS